MRRGVSPSSQDRWLKYRPTPKVTTPPPLIEKVTHLEQELAAQKAENDQLRDIIAAPVPHGFRPQKVAQCVAKLYGLKLSDLRGVSREKRVAVARHHAMWLVKEKFKYLSLPMIGRMFGNRDHTTVLHALKAHPKRVEKGITAPDPDLGWLDEAA